MTGSRLPGSLPNAPVTGWRITSQQEGPGIGPDGRGAQGYTVRFTTGKGQQGAVFITRDQYSPANVRAQVAMHAAQLDEVMDLQG